MPRDCTKKVIKESGPFLEDGEAVVKAVVANPRGSFLAQMNRGTTGVGRAVTQARSEKQELGEAGGIAGSIPVKNAYLAVTDRRLVIFGLTKMGKLASVLAAFGPDELTELAAKRVDRTNHELHLGFADGTSTSYLVIQKQDAAGLAELFNALR